MNIEQCYNLHLKTVRSFKNKPYRLKKDFSDLEKNPSYKHYQNVTNFFNENHTINPTLYFQATAFFHDKEDWIPIKEYTTSRSLTNYVQYISNLNSKDLDDSIDDLKSSYIFIYKFCVENGIPFNEYLDYKEGVANIPVFLIHHKRRDINIHFLFVFEEFFIKLKQVYKDKETYHFYIDNESWTPFEVRKRYMRSVKFKKILGVIRDEKLSETK